MTPDLDAIAKLRKAANDDDMGTWRAFEEACWSFDFDALQSRLAVLEGALRSTLDAMAMDPCDCMAHRSPPEAIRALLTPDPDSDPYPDTGPNGEPVYRPDPDSEERTDD